MNKHWNKYKKKYQEVNIVQIHSVDERSIYNKINDDISFYYIFITQINKWEIEVIILLILYLHSQVNHFSWLISLILNIIMIKIKHINHWLLTIFKQYSKVSKFDIVDTAKTLEHRRQNMMRQTQKMKEI